VRKARARVATELSPEFTRRCAPRGRLAGTVSEARARVLVRIARLGSARSRGRDGVGTRAGDTCLYHSARAQWIADKRWSTEKGRRTVMSPPTPDERRQAVPRSERPQ